MICVDCGFDTDAPDLASAMAVLGDAEARVAGLIDALRQHPSTMSAEPLDLDRILRLCDALEHARRAVLGIPDRTTSRYGAAPIPMYSALAMLSTEASWLQRASRSVSPRSPSARPSPVITEAVHALEHAASRAVAPYSAGETSPLS